MSTATVHTPRAEPFPETEIRAQLAEWFESLAKKRETDQFAPPATKNTLHDFVPDVDSLTVVESFIVVEKLLNYKLPTKIVKKGGYESIGELIEHLVPQIRTLHGTGSV